MYISRDIAITIVVLLILVVGTIELTSYIVTACK